MATGVRTVAATNAAEELGALELLPAYPELPPTFWEQHGTTILLGSVILLALAAVAVWFALRKKPVAPVPPAVQARKELEVLLKLPEDGAVLSRTSQALRRYFIAAFALPPGEFTTAEFCRLVSANEKIGAELSAALAAFLRDCDERKFSAATVPPTGAVGQALTFVERSEALCQPCPVVKP